MSQLRQGNLFDESAAVAPVNVASVPQRSPFRYPGGKTWFVPEFRAWMRNLPAKPKLLIEPFTGGAIIGLTSAFEDLAERTLLVELDPDVAAVWHTILSNDNSWLAETILNFDLNHANLNAALEQAETSTKHRAFATLLKNRVFHGGILAPGSGLIRNGENGRGLASRWYPETLCRRIRDIDRVRHRIEFQQGSAFEVLSKLAERDNAAWFIDPPYHQAGRRLYTCHQIDHAELFASVKQLKGPFLMTYDNAEEIQELAQRCAFATRHVPMKTTHHRQKYELIIEPPAIN